MNSTLAPFPFQILHDAVSRRETLWLLLDGANHAKPLHALYELGCSEHYIPLFCRTHYAHLMSVSPLLVEVTPESPLLSWFLDGHAHDAGFLFGSKVPPELLAKNLRSCLDVRLPDDSIGLLRFCDPQIFADLLRLECSGVMNLLTGDMSFFAVYTTDLDNINIWMYGLRTSRHDISSNGICLLSVEDIELFESINEKRLILNHVSELYRKMFKEPEKIHEYMISEKLDEFELQSYAATHAFHISTELYDKVYKRLELYEEKFNILYADDLFKIDEILETCGDDTKNRCIKIMMNNSKPVHERIDECITLTGGM